MHSDASEQFVEKKRTELISNKNRLQQDLKELKIDPKYGRETSADRPK